MRKAWIVISGLAALLLAAALLLRSQAAVLAVTHWWLENHAELRLELKSAELNLLNGFFRAEELHLYPVGPDLPPLISILGLSVDTSLLELIRNSPIHSKAQAESIQIYVSAAEGASNPRPADWLAYATWLPGEMTVAKLHVMAESEELLVYPVLGLSGRRVGPREFRATAKALFDAELLDVALEIYAHREDQQFVGLDLRAELESPRTGNLTELSGELRGDDADFNYDFRLDAGYPEAGNFLAHFPGAPALAGTLRLQGRMSGDLRGFRLREASFLLDNMPDYGFEAAGELAYTFGGENSMSLEAAGELASLEYLVDWLGLDIADWGKAQANLSLSGPIGDFNIDDFIVLVHNEEGLSLKLSGNLALGGEPDPSRLVNNRVEVDFSAPLLSAVPVLENPPANDPGHWRANAELLGDGSTLSVRGLIIEAGTPDTLALRIAGDVADIAGVNEAGIGEIRGVDVTLSLDSPDIAGLAGATGPTLPPGHRLSAAVSVVGDGPRLQALRGRALLSASDLEVEITDLRGEIPLSSGQWVEGLNGQVSLALTDTAALSHYLEREVLALGPVSATAELKQQGQAITLANIVGGITSDPLSISVEGGVDNLLDLQGIQLRSEFSGIDTSQVLNLIIDGQLAEGSIGYLGGGLIFGLAEERWELRGIEVRNQGSPNHQATLTGRVTDGGGHLLTDLDSHFDIRDPLLLEALTGIPFLSASGDVKSRTDGSLLTLSLDGHAGTSPVLANAEIRYADKEVDGLRASLRVPRLDLADLGLKDRKQGRAPAETSTTDRGVAGIEGLLEKAPRYPTDLSLDISSITGKNTRIDKLGLNIAGEDGRYTLRDLHLRYSNANAEFRGVIDTNTPAPTISLGGEALQLPLDHLLQDLGMDMDVQGKLTVRGGLTASGTDSAALLRTLEGSLGFALRDGVIKGAAYDLLATDFITWMVSGGALQTSTDIDCTLAHFKLQRGIATSDTLFIETARMIATGEAELNFPRRRMDLLLTPRSKSRALHIPSSIRIRGDMDNPRVITSPVAAVADATAEAITLLPRIARRVFGGDRRRAQKSAQPCEAGY